NFRSRFADGRSVRTVVTVLNSKSLAANSTLFGSPGPIVNGLTHRRPGEDRVMRTVAFLLLGLAFTGLAHSHGIAGSDAAFVAANHGAHIFPFVYLGAKHMVTGYDHLL